MVRKREHALTITGFLLVLDDLNTCRRPCMKTTVTNMILLEYYMYSHI